VGFRTSLGAVEERNTISGPADNCSDFWSSLYISHYTEWVISGAEIGVKAEIISPHSFELNLKIYFNTVRSFIVSILYQIFLACLNEGRRYVQSTYLG
jgi:hypothetical protein